MSEINGIFDRAERLLGEEAMVHIGKVRIILFGVGGVGSWCAEGLIRMGVRQLTIVDADRVCETNINRQLMATTKTIGELKVEALKSRLLDINPEADITAIAGVYNEDTSASFQLDTYDYIIDAIDSLKYKVHLIRTAARTKAKLYSSMGAALKMDPTRIKVAEFWKVKGCPLAAALRRKMKEGERPAKKFLCVYSDELLENKGSVYETDESKKSALLKEENPSKKAQINGTLVHITAIFGFTLAGLVVQDICKE
ncbi:tRNA A37 threonylcarbamoyladenosine dehydratase [Dysgonomonas sp. PFB1-18]|uniref:tRNA threonylcarbamoyladenosine dehydratase n=1 Tax=unclassified Dysgonomonas TaxID=2630389 RepID=UPI002474D49B|nr:MULTISPECIES: tRNA threonylcarbamoyladenosine dehydratase [unclassified Dysgonomonas]MDL2303699.1 tRNA threonylcarbamoyladenosine dehydratase [Dysgonomonas sp. OttesenSCG-928-D17]MDH6310111.1 tRNA A37 threonylcarbamoyladenosine dehydratase [Dysgonomonas sp. PF1-14]MDH6340223.1 tRNA A37 threonylcarbamoyladenosine dehydratase [Dysgonomonas sp. PF1-16]MDH6381668.1 tRNA A37 threonylcarbamoyladenosine dehydratase [Dysgonomonas sp. PFB1-18]MDH6399027.1 tRNA A37 threonylcarbamoyladenosine dehydrat